MTVGTTKIIGQAGPASTLTAFLAGDLTEMQVPVLLNNMSWSYGTGANAVNVVYADSVTFGTGANTTLEINGGTLLDVFTRTLTLEAIKFVYIKNNSAAGGLEVLGTAVTALDICKDKTDIILVPPGGTFTWTDPTAAGTDCSANFNLKLLDDGVGGLAANVDVIIMGLD